MTRNLAEIQASMIRLLTQGERLNRPELIALLEALGQDLLDVADSLRHDKVSFGGIRDSVRAQVFGPDGQLKQTIDTGLKS